MFACVYLRTNVRACMLNMRLWIVSVDCILCVAVGSTFVQFENALIPKPHPSLSQFSSVRLVQPRGKNSPMALHDE